MEFQACWLGDEPPLQLPEHHPGCSGTYLGASYFPLFLGSILLPPVTSSNSLDKSCLYPNQKGEGVT